MKKLGLILHFYKSFAPASWPITFSAMIIAHTHGPDTLIPLIWYKIITSAVIIYLVHSFRPEGFYYYKNLGTSKLLLWVSTLSFDFILFIASLVLTLKIR
jgi:hypothetical protein